LDFVVADLGNKSWLLPSRRKTSVCRLLLRAIVTPALLFSIGTAQSRSTTQYQEYQVKGAFLYNFAKFVEWPASAFPSAESSLQICLLGRDPFGRDLEKLIEGKKVNGHSLQVVRLQNPQQAVSCHIVFVASSEKKQIQQILQSLAGASVLTVGETAGFVQLGGIINFVLDEDRVRFEVNLKSAQQAHLKLSARLLSVAKIVLGNQGSGGS
jgi:hypothetical protein